MLITKQKNFIPGEYAECLYDYDPSRELFFFREGSKCEDAFPTSKIGSRITKRAVREMRKRYDDTHTNDDDIISIDYGEIELSKILEIDLCTGIRFYFGIKVKDDKPVLSLILVPIDEHGRELVALDETAEIEELGVEVGVGKTNFDIANDSDLRDRMVCRDIRETR
ncbi:MAG: hypothetical protein H7Z13_12355 [Ferruginibacter sp.]|nr:hypothetical protein [Ferruginibacter sp.]